MKRDRTSREERGWIEGGKKGEGEGGRKEVGWGKK